MHFKEEQEYINLESSDESESSVPPTSLLGLRSLPLDGVLSKKVLYPEIDS